MKLTPPEGFNYKGAIVSLASALSASGSEWRQKIRLREMAVKGKSYLCARQTCNTRAQEAIKKSRDAEEEKNDKWGQMPKGSA